MQPWDRLESESVKLFEQFQQFLALGPTRTVSELSRRLGVTSQGVGRNAARYRWKERAEAWDASNFGKAHALVPTRAVFNPEVVDQADLDVQISEWRQFSALFKKSSKYDYHLAEGEVDIIQKTKESLLVWFKIMERVTKEAEFAHVEGMVHPLVVEKSTKVSKVLSDLMAVHFKAVEAKCRLMQVSEERWGKTIAVDDVLRQHFEAS